MNTKVKIAGVELKNPVMTASGTFGSGMEYSDFVDLNSLGAVVTKGVANVPWEGNPVPRVAETWGGMLNAIGLQNPGIDVFLERDIPFLKKFDTKIIVNVCGKSVEDYLEVVEKLSDSGVDLLEINVSCPNVKEGAIAFGQKADCLYDITSRIKKKAKQPVIMKLSPNVTDIAQMAKAAEAAGKKYNTVNLGDIKFIWPCPASSRITSEFGSRTSPTAGASSNHQGIDIGAASGSGILAAASGTVVIATYSYSAGNYIMINHGRGVYTVYMHCSQLLASEGQDVIQGQTIAKVGSTGYSTGPHLHFGIRANGQYVNPSNYVSP